MNAQERLQKLRQDLYQAIERALEEDDHHKSYEGIFEVAKCYPSYFERDEKPTWIITLHCYVIGPHRHYNWRGETFEVALNKAEHDIRKWIVDDYNGEFFYE